MIRYKLARVVGEKYLSANSMERARTEYCLEYKVGKETTASEMGIACYQKRKQALTPEHIKETKHFFNNGEPIVLLTLQPIGRRVYRDQRYRRGLAYEGGINYRTVVVLKSTPIA